MARHQRNSVRRARLRRRRARSQARSKLVAGSRDQATASHWHDLWWGWYDLESLEPRVLLSTTDVLAAAAESGHDHQAIVAQNDDPLPHPDDEDKQHEHLALLDLVRYENVTHEALSIPGPRFWSDTGAWKDIDGDSIGDIPDAGADVLIPDGTTLIYDLVSTQPLHTVRVDGTLRFALSIDTYMVVDTLVVDSTGTLIIGTPDNPVDPDVSAVIVFPDGPIDTDWDPTLLSRGLISHGDVQIHGAGKTPFGKLESLPKQGDSELVLTRAPLNWEVGDRIAITGEWRSGQSHEEFEILGIDGKRVKVDRVRFNHHVPDGMSLYVANLTRNVAFISEDPSQIDQRGHVMFMHSPNVDVHNAGFYGLGRTDKRNPVDDPVLDDDGHLIEGTGLNPRGRYSAHFHRNGTTFDQEPAVITGSVVVDSPGWGFVNHDSYVLMEDNISFDVVGAGFATEFGSEIGSFRNNLAFKSEGSGDRIRSRENIFDFGHAGHGFWFQGGGVEVVDNIAAGHKDAAFVYFTRSTKAEFLAANLPNPDIAKGQEYLPVGDVPIRKFNRNIAFGSKTGLETWFHLRNAEHNARSVIKNFTTWNVRQGVLIPYTHQATLRNIVVIGDVNNPVRKGIDGNDKTTDILYEDLFLEGWYIGLDVARNGHSVIDGGYFNNVKNIFIPTSHDEDRHIEIIGDVQFGQLSEEAPPRPQSVGHLHEGELRREGPRPRQAPVPRRRPGRACSVQRPADLLP